MASSIPDLLVNMTLATAPPQATFEQADDLLLQATELRLEAVDLQARIDALNNRADILYTTATGLQAIATHDRAIIQARFNRSIDLHTDFTLIHGSATNKSTRFLQLEPRVEDGLATIEEVESFIDDLQSKSVPDRSERSKAPEPDTPMTTSHIVPSVEGDETRTHKRKHTSSSTKASQVKRPRQHPILVNEQSHESQETIGRPASMELGSQSKSVTSKPIVTHGGDDALLSQVDGQDVISDDGSTKRKRTRKSKSKQRKKLIALATTDIGAQSTPDVELERD